MTTRWWWAGGVAALVHLGLFVWMGLTLTTQPPGPASRSLRLVVTARSTDRPTLPRPAAAPAFSTTAPAPTAAPITDQPVPTASPQASLAAPAIVSEGQPAGLTDPAESEVAAAEPVLLDLPKPGYPILALQKGWTGQVVLDLRLDPQGRIVSQQVVSSSRPLFEAVAQAAAAQARFAPWKPSQAGQTKTFRLTVKFVLENP